MKKTDGGAEIMMCLETTFLIDLLRNKGGAGKMQKEFENTEPAIYVAAPSIQT